MRNVLYFQIPQDVLLVLLPLINIVTPWGNYLLEAFYGISKKNACVNVGAVVASQGTAIHEDQVGA